MKGRALTDKLAAFFGQLAPRFLIGLKSETIMRHVRPIETKTEQPNLPVRYTPSTVSGLAA